MIPETTSLIISIEHNKQNPPLCLVWQFRTTMFGNNTRPFLARLNKYCGCSRHRTSPLGSERYLRKIWMCVCVCLVVQPCLCCFCQRTPSPKFIWWFHQLTCLSKLSNELKTIFSVILRPGSFCIQAGIMSLNAVRSYAVRKGVELQALLRLTDLSAQAGGRRKWEEWETTHGMMLRDAVRVSVVHTGEVRSR